MVNDHGLIHKTSHKKGREHDYNIYKKDYPITPKEVENMFDLGFLGAEKDYPEKPILAIKKKRNQDLTRGK